MRSSPRISLNKLGEFITASPANQRRLIKDQKYPPDFKVTYYDGPTKTISDYLSRRERNKRSLRAAISAFNNIREETKRDACIEAINSFMAICDSINLAGLETEKNTSQREIVPIENVEISIRPDVFVTGYKRGTKYSGCIKLYFSKSTPLTDIQADYITILLYEYLIQKNYDGSLPHESFIILIDVFNKRIYTTPVNKTRKFRDIIAACRNISAIWPRISQSE